VKTAGLNKADRPQSINRPAASQQKPSTAHEAEAPMSLRHVAVLLLAGVAVLAVISFLLQSYWNRQQPVFQDAPKLVAALQAFSRDRFLHGNQLPSTVTLKDLVAGGYLSGSDVSAFEGIEVTFSNANTNQDPKMVMIHARLPDGSVLAVLADGSVQQLRK